jgi:hypothetical protein
VPVALRTIASMIVDVRSTTAHDNDTQVTPEQITAALDREYRNLRRFISKFAPTLYQDTILFTLATGVNTYTKPADFERLVRMEYQAATNSWYSLSTRPGLISSSGYASDVAGSYRLTYITRPEDGYTSFDLPDGAYQILMYQVSAWVRNRHEENPTFELTMVESLKKDLRRDIGMRNGDHPVCGMQPWIDDYGRSFYEEGDHFVIV